MTEATPALPLFYKSPRVLTPGAHGQHSLAENPGHAFAAATNAVPLVAEELAVAARHYPVVFSDEATPHPVALLGLRGQHNLFVDADGQWRAGVYVPAYVRRYPFIFSEDAARGELTLCIDEDAAALQPGRERPLFDAAGQPTALTRDALAFCRDYQAQHLLAAAFAQALVAADVLVDHRADVTLRSGERLSLAGFKVIDAERFAKLPDATFLAWRAKGWLPLAYAHFFSIASWSALVDAAADEGR